MTDDKIEKIVSLIQKSELDATIKGILIRDLHAEGLTDFLREQIIAYCLQEIKILDKGIEEAKRILEERSKTNPAA